jgi:DNA polymerase bacteriophage-type
LKSMLRPAIFPGAGRRIVRCDWNAIEARALPWLTARASAVIYLDAFRDRARDLYLEQGAAVGLPGNRQAGKVVVLALGYGGGVRALEAMCKAYGVTIENKQAVVDAWRRVNRWAKEWWDELYRCACQALATPVPGMWFPAGRVGLQALDWGRDPAGKQRKTLKMMLPSGRSLTYPLAELDAEGLRYLKASWKPKADATEWPRARAWPGLLAENATQGVCADLLREALVAAVEGGLPVIGHVHDELVAECATGDALGVANRLKAIMLRAPEWGGGLPLDVEVDISPRYRK